MDLYCLVPCVSVLSDTSAGLLWTLESLWNKRTRTATGGMDGTVVASDFVTVNAWDAVDLLVRVTLDCVDRASCKSKGTTKSEYIGAISFTRLSRIFAIHNHSGNLGRGFSYFS